MAELTANDIAKLLAPTNEGVRLLTIEQEQTTENITSLNSTLANIGVVLGEIFKQVGRISKHVDKPPVIEDNAPTVTEENNDIINPLNQIVNHLDGIKKFLVKTFKPTDEGLSGSTRDRSMPTENQTDSDSDSDEIKESKTNNNNALAWLGGLFAVGATAAIGKVLGIGAAGGVAGGVLGKILPKIFNFAKPILKRIPILGSLFSFWEAYKKFSAGGIDNIIFGLMDVAAGIAYAFPVVGTAIGLGVDVLQYFLKEKADEWKAETGNASFFGSMYDKLIDYLSETPMIKWMVGVGDKFSALWNNPSLETLKEFGLHLAWGPLMPFINTFSMLDDAGAALGLTDKEGNPQKLFSWLYSKVEDYVITPVKDFFTSIFNYIGDVFNSLTDSVSEMILAVVNQLPETIGAGPVSFRVRDHVKNLLGLGTDPDVQAAIERTNKMAAERGISKGPSDPSKANQVIKRRADRAGMSVGDYEFLDKEILAYDRDDPAKKQIYDAWRGGRYKEAMELRQALQMEKSPDSPELPKADLEVDLQDNQTSNRNIQNNVAQTQVISYITPEKPSDRFWLQQLNQM